MHPFVYHLCSCQEDIFSNMSQGTCSDAQAYTWEDVGVVSLTGIEYSPIRQGDGVKRTAAGEDATTLQQKKESSKMYVNFTVS